MFLISESGAALGVGSRRAAAVITAAAACLVVTGCAGVASVTTDGYSHPDYPVSATAGAQPTVTPSGAPVDPYTAGQPRAGGCQETTGT